ncbi:cytochrome bc complex cytochrome b subunit [Kribbella sandramycini]|uniref:Cytochrome bc1 complex cytochrome b subunit n=1 Tax=Kribbella sandramycini TaxID=60450 RepID=A0A7Y4KXE2_9ACTN|nr:cytochrome b N-terminal domain-containing protein [Kribbella sandramycini]MBB6569763.1 ubiquinol-cytochrome c reductase cytochrome b subunit [Kribbella sandramycini]NOL40410.1 cytochrome bc complex cytochrome b subunit [Kribbella sandramycini]
MHRSLKDRVFPDHWSLLFGQIAFYSFVVVMITGVILMIPYAPSLEHVVYDGPYVPLRGVTMSRALDSTLEISFEMRGGLLIRQMHHWGTLLMVAAIMLHLLRLFFTGGFRRPRRLSWLVVFGLFTAMLGAALTGTSLPDDMLSGTSLAVIDGVVKSIPFIGADISALLFAGQFPGDVLKLFYPLHVYVLPVVLVLLFAVAGFLALKHRPAQFPGPGRTNDNIVGRPLKIAVVKAAGLFCFVVGLAFLMGATATINPIWMYGPADAANASAGIGPAWYLAFLDGALRLAPGWEVVWFGRTLTLAILVPVLVCTVFLGLVSVYPFIEGWIIGDRADHNLLERPRNNPLRTGIGVAGIVFYGVLWAAAAADTMALMFHLSVNALIHFFQALLIIGPPLALYITRRICLGLQSADVELATHGMETGRVVRLPSGEYVEDHRALDPYRRWSLGAPTRPQSEPAPRTLRSRLANLFEQDQHT